MNEGNKDEEVEFSYQDAGELKESFGDYLRRHREASGKTIDSISRTTRIAKRYLKAFEENDLINLPEPAFARGFLKAYAAEIGLEVDDCLARYERFRRSLNPTQVREFRRPPKYMILGSDSEENVQLERWLIWGVSAGVVLVILVLGTIWLIRNPEIYSRFRHHERASVQQEDVEISPSEPQPILNGPEDSRLGAQSQATTQKPEPTPNANANANKPPAQAAETKPTAKANANSQTLSTPVRPSLLTITANRDGKFSVRLDDNALQEIQLKTGETHQLNVFREIEIRSPDKNAFTFQYNGKPLEVSGPVIKLFNRYLFQRR